MAISPVNFVTAPPIEAIAKSERIRRNEKSSRKFKANASPGGLVRLPEMPALITPEELASDETRAALQNLKLGG